MSSSLHESSNSETPRFLYAELSTKPLKTTPNILKRLLTFHQVMPVFIDFLTVFAHPPQQRELGFSGFFDQITLSNKFHSTNVAIPAQQPLLANTRQPIVSNLHVPRGPAATSLGRSGRQYQLCYNLKRVARTKGTARDEYSDQTWSVQQSAFHHQFDVEEGTTLWMNAKGRLDDYREQVMELTGDATGQPEELFFKTPEDCFRSSLTVHLMNCHWATHDWRGYINYLEAAIEEQTRHIVVGPWLNEEFTPASLQALQRSEEKATNAIMILEANMEVLTGLKKFFEKLTLNKDFDMRDQSAEAITAFVQQISDMIHAFAGHKRRATLLVNITENRKNLLLQRLQSQATKKMEDLTTMSYRETVGMRIITVGTFVFLPATFVSTFFSTDIIKYQNTEDGKGNFSSIALERWLEVTLPLTAATLFFGFISFLLVDRRRKKRMESWLDEKTKEP
ncbi:hypothetical protein CC78DRAFT_593648 [Lojkania enalia]|uniref:CorA-like transporter domain-containing protein n=1 Tax=Lojkania enalia TaxID=147567 RepID=A0A9P4N682_9PLEO|nr:hypothetical protein CC78DRAFT_593648 [Didymosphaeria enalia]